MDYVDADEKQPTPECQVPRISADISCSSFLIYWARPMEAVDEFEVGIADK